MEHDWPTDQEEHVFGPWFTKDSRTKYRRCIKPECPAVEEVEVQ